MTTSIIDDYQDIARRLNEIKPEQAKQPARDKSPDHANPLAGLSWGILSQHGDESD